MVIQTSSTKKNGQPKAKPGPKPGKKTANKAFKSKGMGKQASFELGLKLEVLKTMATNKWSQTVAAKYFSKKLKDASTQPPHTTLHPALFERNRHKPIKPHEMASKAKAKKTVRFVQDKINETDDPNVALAWAIKAVGASHMTAKDDVLIWLETVRSSLNADDVQERQLRNTSDNVTRIELEQIRDELSTKMDKLADMFANGVPNMQANIGNDGGVHGFSYAAAAKTPPVAPRAPKSTKSLELKITLNGLPPALASELLTLKAFELTRKIEDAIASSDNESVRRTKIQGARMVGKEAIIIWATKNTDAELLGKAANDWLPSVLPGAKIRKPLYQLIIHFVSTEFDPSAEDSIQHLCSSNPHLNLSREMIQSA
jgi:hypothetical protein